MVPNESYWASIVDCIILHVMIVFVSAEAKLSIGDGDCRDSCGGVHGYHS